MRFILTIVYSSFIIGIFFLSAPTFAQTKTADGIIFDAEDATIQGYDKENQIIQLNKKVQIIYQGQFVSCDKASINTKENKMICKGSVRMIGPEAKLEAEYVEINYRNNTGIIKNGFVQVGQVYFEGQEIIKYSENKYKTLKGSYTACTTCPPSWSFSGSKVNAEIGGYAHIQNAVIRFGGVPALWFPYLIVPLKSKRQTGLLRPSYHYSKSDGFTLEESFFWAMSDSQDSTWTAKYYTNRGTKGVVNYRYILSEDSHGEFDFGFLKDKYFSTSDEVLPYNPNKRTLDRWFLKYDHLYMLPYGFVQRINLNSVSDALYPRDFEVEMLGRGDSSLENRFSLTKNTDYSHWSLDTAYYKTLLNENPLESNYYSVHRFPEVNYNFMPMHIYDTDFIFDFNLNYTNFARDNIGYDNLDTNRDPVPPDGKFDPDTDLIRTGQRILFEPSISYPINYHNAIKIVPTLLYRENQYQFSIGDNTSAYRRHFATSLLFSTNWEKVFSKPDDPQSTAYKHIIGPEITYKFVPWYQQSQHPFFRNSHFSSNSTKELPVSNFDEIQFDYRDRIYDENIVTYSITNTLMQKKWTDGSPQYNQILSHRLSQSYDIYENNSNLPGKKPWSEISSLLDFRLNFFQLNYLLKYFPYQNQTTHATRAKIFNARNDFFQLVYSQDFLLTSSKSLNVDAKTEDLTASAGINLKYTELVGTTTYNLRLSQMQSYKYYILFKPPGDCWSFIFSQERRTQSEVRYDFNIEFLFNGTRQPLQSRATL